MFDPDQLLAYGWIGFALVAWTALCVGSFLNVVIYRLPVMLEREWHEQARELLHLQPAPHRPFNLMTPRSQCPSCGTMIRAWQNIPVVSWLVLRGKCGACHARISFRYPAVELFAFLLVIPVLSLWGYSYQAVFLMVFLWSLLVLALIDWDTQYLPDQVTVPLLWLGLIASFVFPASAAFPAPTDSLIGAVAGYLSLWSLFWIFKLATGKDGMGYGDFKLFAATGAWLGWQALPQVILIAAVSGLVYAIYTMTMTVRSGGKIESRPISFGPFLSISGCVTLLAGSQLTFF